jgi:hypothetical protein
MQSSPPMVHTCRPSTNTRGVCYTHTHTHAYAYSQCNKHACAMRVCVCCTYRLDRSRRSHGERERERERNCDYKTSIVLENKIHARAGTGAGSGASGSARQASAKRMASLARSSANAGGRPVGQPLLLLRERGPGMWACSGPRGGSTVVVVARCILPTRHVVSGCHMLSLHLHVDIRHCCCKHATYGTKCECVGK